MSGDSMTLETAEERDLWRSACIAAMSVVSRGHHTCEQIADNAARAYRERLPKRGGDERSVIVPCPGCRNDVLARVVNGRVDDPWCCDCLTEQEPDERTETDVAPEPLIRGSAAPGWRSVEWAGPCARGDSGDASKLQAELTALRERLVELVDGLQRRRSECESLANAPRPMPTASRARCNGKASAYGHAAEMLREALREDS